MILAYALFYIAMAFNIPSSSFSNAAVGPKALPIAIGGALTIAALALIVRRLRGSQEDGGIAAGEMPPQNPVRFAVLVAILVGYVLVFVPLGYVISTFLFIVGVTMYLDRERPVRNVVYALVFSVVVYFVFSQLLGVTLPTGPLGI